MGIRRIPAYHVDYTTALRVSKTCSETKDNTNSFLLTAFVCSCKDVFERFWSISGAVHEKTSYRIKIDKQPMSRMVICLY